MATVLCATSVTAGPFDPPAGYYNTATGTGLTLRSQLHNIIDDHTVLSYNSARANLDGSDYLSGSQVSHLLIGPPEYATHTITLTCMLSITVLA